MPLRTVILLFVNNPLMVCHKFQLIPAQKRPHEQKELHPEIIVNMELRR